MRMEFGVSFCANKNISKLTVCGDDNITVNIMSH